MKVRILKKQVKLTEKKILEDNQGFYEKLILENYGEKALEKVKKKRKRKSNKDA